jgi:hypothetical protein
MSDSTLYDDDILLWSEQQAAAIRKLGTMRRVLPNELDIENVAEEIESVGRSELAAVESYIELIFLHLIKLDVESDSQSARHWRSEIIGFHGRMMQRYAPSMRQRIELDGIWRLARRQSIAAYEGELESVILGLPEPCPFNLDELIVEDLDPKALAERLRA